MTSISSNTYTFMHFLQSKYILKNNKKYVCECSNCIFSRNIKNIRSNNIRSNNIRSNKKTHFVEEESSNTKPIRETPLKTQLILETMDDIKENIYKDLTSSNNRDEISNFKIKNCKNTTSKPSIFTNLKTTTNNHVVESLSSPLSTYEFSDKASSTTPPLLHTESIMKSRHGICRRSGVADVAEALNSEVDERVSKNPPFLQYPKRSGCQDLSLYLNDNDF